MAVTPKVVNSLFHCSPLCLLTSVIVVLRSMSLFYDYCNAPMYIFVIGALEMHIWWGWWWAVTWMWLVVTSHGRWARMRFTSLSRCSLAGACCTPFNHCSSPCCSRNSVEWMLTRYEQWCRAAAWHFTTVMHKTTVYIPVYQTNNTITKASIKFTVKWITLLDSVQEVTEV